MMKHLTLFCLVGVLLATGPAMNETEAALFNFDGQLPYEHSETREFASDSVSPEIEIAFLGDANVTLVANPSGTDPSTLETGEVASLSQPALSHENRVRLGANRGLSAELAPHWEGAAHGSQVLEFFTKSGGFAREADGSVADGASYQQIDRPAESDGIDKKNIGSSPRWANSFAYESTAENPASGGELWLMLYNLQLAVSGKADTPKQDRHLLYGGFALIGLVLTWRARRKRQVVDEQDLESYQERATGHYTQSRRSTSSCFIRLVSDDGEIPANALIYDSLPRRVGY